MPRSRRSHKPRDIQRATLPNGIRVVSEQMPHVRSVTLGIWIGSGSREESEVQTGLSHFVEHMVFKGTKNRSAEQIARSVGQSLRHLVSIAGFGGAVVEHLAATAGTAD